jgi:glycosyltransferase involved in cell wall biosynthesis
VTIHDLPPLRFDDEGTMPGWAARSARAAAVVICPSEFAADEVSSLLGTRRPRVVPNGVDHRRADVAPLSAAELSELGVDGPAVVHAGGATRRKNLDALAAAWRDVVRLRPDAVLVLCGPPDIRRDAAFAGQDRVRFLGFRSPSFVARLMRSAAAVVVPSTYEGFGLPALEGMVAGAPVVAAARGALPEVCGNAALLVEPTAEGIAAGLVEALAGGPAIDALVARGRERSQSFSWERMARATLAVYAEALG